MAVEAGPRYGTALYEYYLGNYWNALTELMIAKGRGDADGHGDQPLVMEGTFSLAYGMEDRAGDIFRRVLGADNAPDVRDSAWFHLARMHYLRGELDNAARALARISAESPKKFGDQLRALRINLAIRQGDLARARELLQEQTPSDNWLPYLHYNLGTAESRAGNLKAAIAHYNRVAALPLWTEEGRTVYDRAMTAAGYDYLYNQLYPQAQAQFSRVQVDSPLASSAMLGYGWAAAEQGNFLDALTSWQHLIEQAPVNENTLEALLAVPYAYEQLGNKGMALHYFEEAAQRFSAEMEVIAEAMVDLKNEVILDRIRASTNSGSNWLDYVDEGQADEGRFEPPLVYLTALFARDSFQIRVQELRDLLAIRERLQQWQGKLVQYNEMLDEREARRRNHAEYLRRLAVADRLETMRARRNQLAEQLARVEREQDYLALAAGQQARLRERVQAAERGIAALVEAGETVDDYREAHRRYAGLLLWQASEDFSERLRQAQNQLAQLDVQLRALKATYARVQRAVNNAEDPASFRERIAAGQQRLIHQLDAVDAAINRSHRQLRGQIAAVLQEQHERLRDYLAQSRLAIARLYDTARLESGGERP